MRSNVIHFATQIDPEDSIPQFFSGKNVFITGGSGFMGKVLIEKLLRTCPDIGNIYILLREKFDLNLEERVQQITNNILFGKLRERNENALKKIVPIQGDVRELNLGLSEYDRKILIENVSIVYHVAATVRFDETLADSVIMNTRGTREVCELVLSLNQVDGFLHVSTAYCQHDKKVVEEKLYPPHVDWKKMIKIVENTDQYKMKIISSTIMHGFPNTYTYSKGLAEAVITDMCQGKVPTVIIRPTIVVSVYKDPLPGWIDNMNGPNGLIAASSKGILRSTYVNYDAKIDFIPVDIAINTFIKATWIQQYLNNDHIAVYNCSSEGIVEVSSTTIQEIGQEVQKQVTPNPIWYPSFYTTDSKFMHLCNVYLFHLIPAIIVDIILKCIKNPPRLLKLQRKIFLALGGLEYFIQNQWVFRNDKFLEMDDYLCESDSATYFIDFRGIVILDYYLTAAKVGMELILKEDLSDVERNKRKLKRMGYVHNGLKSIISLGFLVFAFNHILVPLANRFIAYFAAL